MQVVPDTSATPPAWAANDLGPVVISQDHIAARVHELGRAITEDYAGDPPLLVGVLKGASMFMTDLARSIELAVDLDFMAVSSYGSATKSSGIVRIVKDLEADLSGRHVLVDPHAPYGPAIIGHAFHIGRGPGVSAFAQGVLGIVAHLEPDPETVAQRGHD